MKTKLFFVAAFLIFSSAAMAQFNIGVKGGVNISKVDDKAFRDEFTYGYHLGGFAEVGLGKRLKIQPEVLWNQINTRADTAFSNIYSNALDFSNYKDVKLNYLSIPVLLSYKLGNVLYLQAGPQFGILLNQDKTLLENGKEAFSKGDFSMLGGVQLNVSKLRLSGRYFVGLNNISEIDDNSKWKNQGFQISAGFAL
jgi:hypothetical protein